MCIRDSDEGVIRIQKKNGKVKTISLEKFDEDMQTLIQAATTYGDAGEEIPDVYVFFGKKIVDLSGLISMKQIISIAKVEAQGLDSDTKVVALACSKA